MSFIKPIRPTRARRSVSSAPNCSPESMTTESTCRPMEDARLEGFVRRLLDETRSGAERFESIEALDFELGAYFVCPYCGRLIRHGAPKEYCPWGGCNGCTTRLPPIAVTPLLERQANDDALRVFAAASFDDPASVAMRRAGTLCNVCGEDQAERMAPCVNCSLEARLALNW